MNISFVVKDSHEIGYQCLPSSLYHPPSDSSQIYLSDNQTMSYY